MEHTEKIIQTKDHLRAMNLEASLKPSDWDRIAHDDLRSCFAAVAAQVCSERDCFDPKTFPAKFDPWWGLLKKHKWTLREFKETAELVMLKESWGKNVQFAEFHGLRTQARHNITLIYSEEDINSAKEATFKEGYEAHRKECRSYQKKEIGRLRSEVKKYKDPIDFYQMCKHMMEKAKEDFKNGIMLDEKQEALLIHEERYYSRDFFIKELINFGMSLLDAEILVSQRKKITVKGIDFFHPNKRAI